MDFEVLGENDRQSHLLLALENYFRQRRRQLQDWDSRPPHALGIFILIVALLEVIVSRRLLSSAGFSSLIFTHALMGALAVTLVEVGLARIGFAVATYFKKKGRVGTTITFFNLGLLPLLLVLPITLVATIQPSLRPVVVIGWILLMAKVVGNWRESLEVSYELSRLQSTLVIYAATALFIVVIVFGMYVGFISTLTQALQ